MGKQVISSETGWERPYGFSQGIKIENVKTILFLAGQASMDSQGLIVHEGDIKAQTRQALENVKAMLEAAGFTLDDVVKETVYVTDMKYLIDIMDVRSQYYKEPPPSTYVGVKSLSLPELMVEIEVIAAKPKSSK